MAKREILKNDLATVRVDESVADVVENVVDTIDTAIVTTVDTVERVVTVTKNNPFVLAGVLVVGAALGGAVAYKLVEKRLIKQYDERLQDELEKTRTYYKKMAKEGEFESPEAAVQALVPEEVVDAQKTYQGRPNQRTAYNKPTEIVENHLTIENKTLEVNVFTDNAPDEARGWDYDVELAKRAEKPDEPYVINFDEFNEGQDTFDKTNLTYYQEDDTLVDERDQPIDNVEYIVGDDNLTKFGHGSNDHNVVYVRNEKIGTDFEIIRSKGSYQHEVLGLNDAPSRNLRHSHGRRRRGFDED